MTQHDESGAIDAMQGGIDSAADKDPVVAKIKAEEAKDVQRWLRRIDHTRRFDEEARKQYAIDRRYARGDSGFEVSGNIIGTYIDITEAFLYAKQPDVDVLPSKACEPPSIEAIREAAQGVIDQSPEVTEAGRTAFAAALYQGVPQPDALNMGLIAEAMKSEEMVEQEFQRLREHYEKVQRDRKAFAETLELVIVHLWRQGRLKFRGRPWVRSGLTVGAGILKATWQERTAPSAESFVALNDLQFNIKRAAALRSKLNDPTEAANNETLLADYKRQLETLRAQTETVAKKGFVIELVQAEDFSVTPGYTIANHCDAPWNSHRIPKLFDEAQAEFELDDEAMAQAKIYSVRKPAGIRKSSAAMDDVSASDADAYTSGYGPGELHDGPSDAKADKWVMVHEIWDRETGCVLTCIEGVRCWVKPHWRPAATTRFYPFFLFVTSEVDGDRHPQSLVARSAKLVDEYYRIGSAEAEHRRRVRPKLMFNRGLLGPDDVRKVESGVTQEMVGLEPTKPNTDLRGMFVPVAYAALDPALYSRDRIVTEIERIWGVQEALTGTVEVEKTATEADYQQAGFQARTGGRRDVMETALSELALYTAEVARAYLTDEDVRTIGGPGAMWPAYDGAEDLRRMVDVEIRAGSSGKPNTAAERQAWGEQLPLLQGLIDKIGMLRASSPLDIADCHERLARITAERSGDRLDIDQLMPRAVTTPVSPLAAGMGAPEPGAPAPTTGAEPAPTQEPAAATAA